jgi:Helicase conserved C-terminal domain
VERKVVADQELNPVLEPPTPAAIRDELQRLVIADLHGPLGGEYEEFGRELPTERYLLGRLAPDGTMIEPDDQDENPPGDVLDPTDPPPEPTAPNITSLSPSSLGCTICVAGETTALTVAASWASYERVPNEADSGPSMLWRRKPTRGQVTVALNEGDIEPTRLSDEYPEVLLRGRARRHDGNWLVSLFLVNAQPKPAALRDTAWLFQVELVITGQNGEAVFLPRPDTVSGGDTADRAEQRRLAMAHRQTPEIATGHGAGVHVTPDPADPMRAVEVRTQSVPTYEVPFTDVPSAAADQDLPGLAELVLDMKELAERADADLISGLSPLVTAYRDWIDAQEDTLAAPGRHLNGYHPDAREAIKSARRAANRIAAGIETLSTDTQARAAFRFANRAMHLQRVHIKAADVRGQDRDLTLEAAVATVDQPGNRSWRPFQLAFFLLNLPSLTDPAHPERADDSTATADLLWFPTGGGKTEAYLGLTAYTLAIRRLQADIGDLNSGDGIAVLMRYTLRLLTIQQFQRAAALICACEVIRREDPQTWGVVPFRIGLWVGSRVTPNRTNDADDWLKQQRGGRGAPSRALGSPHQLTACPWCGAELQPGRDFAVDMVIRRTSVTCPDAFCPFGMALGHGDGLPVVVVDEEIYRLLPSLVIGTVDKFAQLTWRGETQALFGRVRRRCTRHGYVNDDLMATDWELSTDTSRHDEKSGHPAAKMERVTSLRPPDLIIQDELHLISGPLGSLTGLYEAAVDRLATWEIVPNGSGWRSDTNPAHATRVRPKVIASSATVRRAPRQIGALFDRHTEVFPPPGIDIGDSFFARQRPPQQHPGRRYVGICAHGARMKSTLIRVYVSVLGAAQKVHEKYGKNPITDPYMTLVGYFNSLRDLGGMRRLVEDDVSARLTRAEERGLARRYDPLLKELTSRLSSTDIPGILDQLSVPFPRIKDATPPIDVLLATNMIAVGVDVSRLGVMVLASQPKSTAEYVQATSRVGRAAPGLVFTVFNWARPRDLSHYESFEYFHATFYRHVEALSVTPFADRAVDRGLTGVLIALVRELSPAYNANMRAGSFDRNDPLADHIVRHLQRRAENVTGDRKTGLAVQRLLDERLDQWNRERHVPGRRLSYDAPGTADDVAPLLRRPDGTQWRRMTCPTSLRDVEPAIRLLLISEGDTLDVTDEPSFEPVIVPDDIQSGEATS